MIYSSRLSCILITKLRVPTIEPLPFEYSFWQVPLWFAGSIGDILEADLVPTQETSKLAIQQVERGRISLGIVNSKKFHS